jgi:predicted DNA-binding transcriptional regulator YafY
MPIGLVPSLFLIVALVLTAWGVWDATRAPLRPMTSPSTAPLLRRHARQAARDRRRMWIKYREPSGEVIERTVEIYHTTVTGHISGWCRSQRSRATFRRDRILAWQLLHEQFERSDGMQAWSRWQGWRERLREFRGMARGH